MPPAPGQVAAGKVPPPSSVTSYGQVIEYIQDRLYLASYTHPPNESTPFPYPSQPKSPSKRSSKSQSGPVAVPTGPRVHPPAYFTVDDTLLYNRFHADFGPLHIGHLYRFAVQLHDVLADPVNAERGLVFWSRADPRSRANAAGLLACYMILIQNWPPHLALAPIAQADPPLMPFRDAGYSQADYTIGVQDVVYGVWRAKEAGLCALKQFSLEEYELYERVDMGDFNWVTPDFLAFASPQHKPTAPILPTSPSFSKLPKDITAIEKSDLPQPFKNVLAHFKERNIGLVVRLNSELYCPSYFTALGINHLDMIFDDGTCPPLALVKRFIKLAHEMITIRHQAIAVHCKAGLGRTGCLIGAYLIYRYGFTANEIIAYMRFMRPGMVVGPQQHWLHLNQGTFREWWWEDIMKEKLAAVLPSTPVKGSSHRRNMMQTATPPNGSQSSRRAALGEINTNEANAASNTATIDDNLPAPTPGQPRKTSRIQSPQHKVPNSKYQVTSCAPSENDDQPENEIVEMRSHRKSHGQGESESEEEWQLRMLSRRKSSSRSHSPMMTSSAEKKNKKRAVSYTTTTTTTTNVNRYNTNGTSPTASIGGECGDDDLAQDIMSDVENWGIVSDSLAADNADEQYSPPNYPHIPLNNKSSRPKTPGSTKSGNGSGALGVSKIRGRANNGGAMSGSPRRSNGDSREVKANSGVRKTSGRVGSASATAVARTKS